MENRDWRIVMNLDGETEDSGQNCQCGKTCGSDCGCGHEHGHREEAREELQLVSVHAQPFYTGSYLKHRR